MFSIRFSLCVSEAENAQNRRDVYKVCAHTHQHTIWAQHKERDSSKTWVLDQTQRV